MYNLLEKFLEVRKAFALFCAENNIIYHSRDARYETATPITDEPEVIARWHEFLVNLQDLRGQLSKEDAERYNKVEEICQAIGHVRLKETVSANTPRFVCITCCCMFDISPGDVALIIPGGLGIPMPGLVVKEPKP